MIAESEGAQGCVLLRLRDSFGMIRDGNIDAAILGTMKVSATDVILQSPHGLGYPCG